MVKLTAILLKKKRSLAANLAAAKMAKLAAILLQQINGQVSINSNFAAAEK